MAAASTLLLTLAALAAPRDRALDDAAERFRSAWPLARLLVGAHGGLAHASGLLGPLPGRPGEAAARRFLAANGAAFGLGPGAEEPELLRLSAPAAAPGFALFRRRRDGLPIFGGEVAVGWAADGGVHLLNGSRSLATLPLGRHAVPAAVARRAALEGAPGRSAGEVRVEPGWLEFGGRLRPVWRVSWPATEPFDSLVALVDGERGGLIHRSSRRKSASLIRTYRVSPLSPAPAPPGGYATVDEPAGGLRSTSPGSTLDGEVASVYGCRGRSVTAIPGSCTVRTRSDGSGSFLASPDPTQVDVLDPFAEQSAYYHTDRQARFLESLDPGFAGLRGLGVFVNAFDQNGLPLDNAFFAPELGGTLVFGQGTSIDVSYDGEVVSHEVVHAAVAAAGGFAVSVDPQGPNLDPAAIEEGLADALALANPDDLQPCLGAYFASPSGSACLRNARNQKTCRGNGAADPQNPGRSGEIHLDGEIWSGFAWSLLEAAMDRDAAAGGGSATREAMTRALFRAAEAVVSSPTFEGFAAAVAAQAGLEPALGPAGADLATCVAAQRDFPGCADRAVPVYGGESVTGVLNSVAQVSPASLQYFLDVPCGATALHVRFQDETNRGFLYVRYGAPVEFGSPDLSDPVHDWLIAGDVADAVIDPQGCRACTACGGQTPLGGGRWYFLPAGLGGARFEIGLGVDAPPGTVPVRQPYLFGPGTGANLCDWGSGPTPAPLVPPAYRAPPPSGCPPAAPSREAPPQCLATTLAEQAPASCACGSGGSAGGLALLGALLLVRRRRPR